MREWLARFRDWLRRDQLDRELTEELRFPRNQPERDASEGGQPGDAARYAARRSLGQVTRHQEESRERWSWPWLDHFQKDLCRRDRFGPEARPVHLLDHDAGFHCRQAAHLVRLLVGQAARFAVPALRATGADPNPALRSD